MSNKTQLKGNQILDKSITVSDITLSGASKSNLVSLGDEILLSNGNGIKSISLPSLVQSIKSGFNITIGGDVGVDLDGHVKWTNRFMISSAGRGVDFSSVGYYYVEMPVINSVISGVGGASNVAVNNNGILLSDYQSLYYELPIGLDSTSIPGNFKIVSFSSNIVIPHNWILLCTVNGINQVYFFPNGVKLKRGQSINLSVHDAVNADTIDGFHVSDLTGHTHTEYSRAPISITYSDLILLISTSSLIVGQRYIISDYQTTYIQPISNVPMSGATEPLLVTALTNNKLMNIAYSTLHTQDLIYYNVNNDQDDIPGCTKGYIYRRIDTLKNNDIGFDFRNVKFRRWLLNVTTSHVDGNSWQFNKGDVVVKSGTDLIFVKIKNENGFFYDTNIWCLFPFLNSTYIIPSPTGSYNNGIQGVYLPSNNLSHMDYYLFSTEPTINGVENTSSTIYNNIIKTNKGNRLLNTVFFSNIVFDNIIGYNLMHNTFNHYMYGNVISNNCKDNICSLFMHNHIGMEFVSNIMNGADSNNIGNEFSRNIASDGFNGNYIGNNVFENVFGAEFYHNKINPVYDSFDGNTIGFNVFKNEFNLYCSQNVIGNSFRSNKTNFFSNNTIGDDALFNDFNGGTSNIVIGQYANNNVFGSRFNNNIIGDAPSHNVFGSDINNLTLGHNFTRNKVDNFFNNANLTGSTYVYQQFEKTLFVNKNNQKRLRFFDENDSLVIKLVTE